MLLSNAYFRISLVTLVLLAFVSSSGIAFINLSIVRPTSDFTTNNQLLRIDGAVKSSVPQVIVSTDTPPGVIVSTWLPADGHPPSQLPHSIYSVILDVGSLQQLKSVLIRPVINGQFPFGPRRIRIAFSHDGSHFEAVQHFNVPSNLHPVFHRVVVAFPSPVSARFVQIDMLEGWQRSQVAIESIEFLDAADQLVQASVEDMSILLNLNERSAVFSIEMLLKAGDNAISLFARPLSIPLADLAENRAQQSISPFYLPELQAAASDEGWFVLSDGAQATIVIPDDAFGENIKKLQFFAVPPSDVPDLSYQNNTRIATSTAPVVVYRFEALKQGRFAAEASSALSTQPPALAFDGILEPPSTWMTGLAPLPVHLTVDLGDHRTVSRAVVHANVVDGQSFGPQSAKILISNDNISFTEILEVSDFNDVSTTILFPTRPSTRYIRLQLTESKQANNVQLNEVEFFDASGLKIAPFVALKHLVFEKPILLELGYTESDLVAAGVSKAEDLRIFAWDASAQEWQLAGGRIDLNQRLVRLELNYITQFALFQAVPKVDIQAVWSFNPFSPDGNGIADTTRLTITNPAHTQTGQVELTVEIFDLHNRLVRTLVNRTVVSANPISVEWDGRDRTGRIVNIGPYIYQIWMGSQVKNGLIVVGK